MFEQTNIVDQATSLRRMVSLTFNKSSGTPSEMITITSGKGGVGKSLIALNLAIKLAANRHKVLLVDADTNLGNIDIMMGIKPSFSLSDVLKREVDIKDALVLINPNLSLLCGSSGIIDYPSFNEITQQRFISDLKNSGNRYSHIIIDTSAGISKEIIGYATASGKVIVVATPEPTSVVDAYALIKVIASSNNTSSINLLINNFQKPEMAQEAAQKLNVALAKFLNLKVRNLGNIPADNNVKKAIEQQVPIVEAYPNSAFSLSIKSIANELAYETSKHQRIEAHE